MDSEELKEKKVYTIKDVTEAYKDGYKDGYSTGRSDEYAFTHKSMEDKREVA